MTALLLDERAVSWAELDEAVARAADSLPAAGVVLEEPTARLERIAVLHACLERGVPAILVHPRAPAAEHARLAELLVLLRDAPRDRCQVVVPTSGTGGAPRGVILSAAALEASARASEANLGWRDEDRWFAPLPLAHVGGLMVLVRCRRARRTAMLVTGGEGSAAALALALARGATLASLVPTQLHRLVEAGARPPPGLRAVLVGGAAASSALLAGAAALGWPVLPSYGATETCSQVVTWPYGTAWATGRGVGRPLPGVEVRAGEGGELAVRGPMLASGVVTNDGVTWWAPDRWHLTGDLGAVDEHGQVHVHGRRDDLVITGGENVAPGGVEAALLAVPGVRDAAVFGLPDDDLGQKLAAVLVVAADFSWERLGDRLRALLPVFAWPRAWAVTGAISPPAGVKRGQLWLRQQFSAQVIDRPGLRPERLHRVENL